MPQTSRIALFVVLQTLGAIGNVLQNSNRREYDTLCTFIGLAESGIEVPDVEETYKENYDYIQTINMSVSLPSWRSMFFKGPQKTDWHDTQASAKQDGKGYDKMWSTWLDAAQKLAQDPLPNNIKDSAALKLSPEGAAHVRPMIKAVAAKAHHLRAALTELNPEARKLTADAAIKTLKEAAYGKDNKKASDVTATDAWRQCSDRQQRRHLQGRDWKHGSEIGARNTSLSLPKAKRRQPCRSVHRDSGRHRDLELRECRTDRPGCTSNRQQLSLTKKCRKQSGAAAAGASSAPNPNHN
uniref:Variant surface glycoprotein n=1 Tax=Trypanosoma brucei TaxID=5691 RepID=A0A1V0FY83_9TRYP|nr:variant surface glycoprotein [Trypanosoma brucei]